MRMKYANMMDGGRLCDSSLPLFSPTKFKQIPFDSS